MKASTNNTKKRSSFASCLACRAQHCACDEIRPCNRCSRLGIACTEGVSRKAKTKQPHYQLDTPATSTLMSVPFTDLEKELFLDRPELHFQPATYTRAPLSQSLLSTNFPPAHMITMPPQQQSQPQQQQQQQQAQIQQVQVQLQQQQQQPPQSDFVAFSARPVQVQASGSAPNSFYPTVFMQTFNVGGPQMVMPCDPQQQSTIVSISSDGTPLPISTTSPSFPISPSTYSSSPNGFNSASSSPGSFSTSPASLSPDQADNSSPSQSNRSPSQIDLQHSPQQLIPQPIPLPQLPAQYMQTQQHSPPQQQQQNSPQPSQSQELQVVSITSQKKMEKLEKEVQDLKHELWLARQQRVATIPFLTNVQPRNMAMSMWRLPEAELVDFSAGFHNMLSLNVYDHVTFTSISPEELRGERTSLWAFFAREKPVLCGLLTKKPLITGKGERIVPQTVCSLFHYGNSTLMQCTFWLN